MGYPALIGAAIGAAQAGIRGKNVLKGAAIGGAIGATGGAAMGAMGAGAAAAGAGTAAGTAGATGATAGGLLGGAGAGITSAGASGATATGGLLGGSALPSFSGMGLPSIAEGGSAMGALDAGAASAGTTGLSNSLIPTMNLANSTGAASSSMMDMLKQYGTVDNLKGAMAVANMAQPQQQPTIQGGGSVKVGQAPTGDIYDELRKVGYTLPKRRETNFSLLG
jgi:hypothetical protein